jgi:hypothetical protein
MAKSPEASVRYSMGIGYAVWRNGSPIPFRGFSGFFTIDGASGWCRGLRLGSDHTCRGHNHSQHHGGRSFHRSY